AKGRQARGQRHAALRLIERLKMGFEHRILTLGGCRIAGNVTEFDENRCTAKNLLAFMWTARFAVTQRTSSRDGAGEIFRECLTRRRGDTPCPRLVLRNSRPRPAALPQRRPPTRNSVA